MVVFDVLLTLTGQAFEAFANFAEAQRGGQP